MNMMLKRWGAVAFAFLCMSVSLCAKVERTTVYMFGFSASFTDSVAYITDVQRVDSAYIDTKTDFLLDRVVYSDQLQVFMESLNVMKDCTCAVLFSTKKSKLEEEYKRLRKRYQEDGGIVLKDLAAGQFKFQAPSYIPAGAEEGAPEETEQKSDNPGKEE